ncbi:MAG: pyridoxal-phosphate dependent enzyme [Candidatus Bathyarchaeia archaeon]
MKQELAAHLRNLNFKDFYSWLRNSGIGFTPIIRLPKKINPFDDNIQIFAKLEYTNNGESIKARPFAAIHFLNKISGRLNSKCKAVAATSGNFGLSGAYILDGELEFTVYMSENTVKENRDLIAKLLDKKVTIETFSDRYCPTIGAKRGMAIAAARYLENLDSKTINYDQYDDIRNPLSHYLTTGPEIYLQTDGTLTHFLAGLGTCGTIIGCGLFLKKFIPEIRIIGLVPEEGHHQLGLRSKDELGASTFYKEALNICDEIIEISDKKAYEGMLKLWDAEIPAGISSGTNFSGALEIARKVYHDNGKGVIVTVFPDSCENYENFLKIHMLNIADEHPHELDSKIKKLKLIAEKARKKHVSKLKAGHDALYEKLIQIAETFRFS